MSQATTQTETLRVWPDEVPDADLWRASSLLSIFAHSYVRSEPREAGTLPACIEQPWSELTERLMS